MSNLIDWLEVTPNARSFDLLDAHVHPCNRTPDGRLCYDDELLRFVLPNNGVGLAIVMAAGSLEFQYEQVGALCKENPWLVPIAWVRPNHDSLATTERLLREGGFRGLKMHPTVDGYKADDRLVDPFIALARRYGVPVQIHSATDDPSRPERIAALAARFPTVPIVMVHLELGELKKRAALEIVRSCKNLYAETSWTNADSVIEAIRLLGSHRTLFGTDATVDGWDHFTNLSIPDARGQFAYSVLGVVDAVREAVSPLDFANWTYQTAMRLYRLRLAS